MAAVSREPKLVSDGASHFNDSKLKEITGYLLRHSL
jgi:hypothetical protein